MKRGDIERLATDVLRDHGLLSFPVDPLKVSNALGVKVMNAVFSEEDKSGAIVRRGDHFSIFVNANDPPARKRFTIAHEIGHKLLHMKTGHLEFVDKADNFRSSAIDDVEGWTEERRREWEANVFAAALLMNEDLLRDRWQTEKNPAMLAWKFQVSQQAMTIRLAQLGLLGSGI